MADWSRPQRRSRRELDMVADGAHAESTLGQLVSEMRSLGEHPGVEPNRALTEFVSAPRRPHDVVVAPATTHSKARIPVIAQLSALAATTVGKVVLTGSVAAAAVGGAVAVNELQDPMPAQVIATADDDSSSLSSSSTSTSSTTSSSTTTTTVDPPDGTTSSTTSSSSTTIAAGVSVADTEAITLDADGAGTVIYQVLDGRLVLIDAIPAEGWTLRNESTAFEIDLSFRTPDDTERVDVDIEFEDGVPRARIERETDHDDRDDDDEVHDDDLDDDNDWDDDDDRDDDDDDDDKDRDDDDGRDDDDDDDDNRGDTGDDDDQDDEDDD